jgi:hypothetical protein
LNDLTFFAPEGAAWRLPSVIVEFLGSVKVAMVVFRLIRTQGCVYSRAKIVVVFDTKHPDVPDTRPKPGVSLREFLDCKHATDGIYTIIAKINAALLAAETVLGENTPDICVGVLP